ncbi:MAG: DeoR family transcriptional regulator [Ilumatobacter coccineus]|uniref:DeoR family transcriptional regulator n=1 Tax=Ilumatobacter coccineus TaxID=467094 RepID=A0A2G6KAM9_9ACTN|nr:MAG: DeoR family transcriptional regulator [Ilumatobacter coccineus]
MFDYVDTLAMTRQARGVAKRGRPSLARQRHEFILSEIRRAGSVRVNELAERLDVSAMTVRRDLEHLDDSGLVIKVHGGATANYQRSTDEPGFAVKASRNHAEKVAIARSAAVLVGSGLAIGLTAGTTTVRLASELVAVPHLTVVTNSIPAADVFHAVPREDRSVILVGGERTPSDALVGPVAVSALRNFHLDVVMMGVHGIHETAGFTTPNLLEAATNRAFIEGADQLVVLADHTKWGITGLSTIVPLHQADICITDDGITDEARMVLRDRVGHLIVTSDRLFDDEPLYREAP